MRSVITFAAMTLLAGCGQSGSTVTDRYAGLDAEIIKWRQAVLSDSQLCQTDDHGCEAFEVACKAERDLTAEDQAKGITTRVVSAMTYSGFDPKTKQIQQGSVTAQFDRTGEGWSRTEREPVNLSTCADLA